MGIAIHSAQGFAAGIKAVCCVHPVSLVYLFGSHARAAADAESDIDIGVLADQALSMEERHRLRLDLVRALADSLSISIEKIDVVILQDVPPLLQYNVIRSGQVLFVRNIAIRAGFELAVERAYDEECPYLNREADVTIKRILSRVV